MTLIAAKAKLLDYIEHADEKKIMALLSLFESDEKTLVYDEAVLTRLRQRNEEYRLGKLKTYSMEESTERIKQYRLANGL